MNNIFKLVLKNSFTVIMSLVLAVVTVKILPDFYSIVKGCPAIRLDNFDCNYVEWEADIILIASLIIIFIIFYLVIRKIMGKLLKGAS